LLKGAALSATDQKNEAIKLFRQMVSAKIEEASAYNNLAVIYASRGDYDAARLALEWAVRSKPDYGTAHHNLGNVYANLAALNYRQALQLDGKDQSLPAKLSRLGDLLGHPAENVAESKPTANQSDSPLARSPAVGYAAPSRPPITSQDDASLNARDGRLSGKGRDANNRTSDEIESVYARMQLDRQKPVYDLGVSPALPVTTVKPEQAVEQRRQPAAATATPVQAIQKRAESLSRGAPEAGSVYARLLIEKQSERSRQAESAAADGARGVEDAVAKQPAPVATYKIPSSKAMDAGRRTPSPSATRDARSPVERRDDYRNGNWVAGRLALRL
jgi:hypothetical protein